MPFDKDDPRYAMHKFKEHARKKGKLTPKMERSMQDLEGMLVGVEEMGKQFSTTIDNLG